MMQYRSGIRSEKLIEKRRKKRQVLLFLALLCLVTFSASAILVLRAPFLQIKNIVVEGSTFAAPEAVSAAALSSLSGSYFGTIPKSSTFFFSKNQIDQALASHFKQIGDFTIHRRGLSGLRVVVKERTPAAVVCSGFREDGYSNCFWSDEKGMVFSKMATTSTPITFNHYYIPSEQSEVSPGTNFVTEKRFGELQKFIKGSILGGLLPLGVLIGENGEYEMYVKNRQGDSEVTIYFDDRASFDTTLENLLAFWQNSTNAKKATTTQAFNYINLRFGNTVYYSTQ
jgi:hypothetical protein